MMDFSGARRLSVPEGKVKRIVRKSDGLMLWKAGYVNLIPEATTDPGGTSIYNDTGYRDKYRWSSSGNAATAHSYGRLSGWIPFVSGATYRIKGFHFVHTHASGYVSGGYCVYYKNDGTTKTVTLLRTGAEYDSANDIYTMTVTDSTVRYFRISGYWGDDVPIITINEEITE